MMVQIRYYAMLREQAGVGEETLNTNAQTLLELWAEVAARHNFTLERRLIRAAVDDEFQPMNHPLVEGARVVFLPPVAGG